jgi:hypothetical protein
MIHGHRAWRLSVSRCALLLAVLWGLLPNPAAAGPPYVTDDPEPVEYQHWELYLASMASHDDGVWSGTAPHLEVNYGVAPNLQLHTILPIAFVRSSEGVTSYGYGDSEIGAKYRFLDETAMRPMVGTFPLVEIPTGDRDRGLGGGHVRLFFPVWLQKRYGAWTTYGGGGYWVNPGAGNHDWCYLGWLVQRQLFANLDAGVEVYHTTVQQIGGEAETRFNFGMGLDVSDRQHVLVSAGRGLEGPNQFQSYVAYQLTF